MVKWEYEKDSVSTFTGLRGASILVGLKNAKQVDESHKFIEWLDDRGGDGWEAFSYRRNTGGSHGIDETGDYTEHIVLFKRPISPT